ncbi:MAG TPA: DNA polymerase [Candidatus Paceibacterota bacterium]
MTDRKLQAKSSKLVLLDSHAIIHRAYHALPEFSASSTGEPTGALYGLVAMLIKMIQDLKPDYIVAAFDLHGPTYRHEAYEAYKSGRKENDKNLDLQLERAKDIFEAFGIPVYSHVGFEADDIIGTITKKVKNLDIVIASGDMDTMQLVEGKRVQVYTLKKGINDTILYNEKLMEERFGFPPKRLVDYKGLRGDPSDNIIGVKGIGEKTATTLIQEFGTIENIYKNLDKAKLSDRFKKLLEENEEEALFSKTLATIRTDAPIDFKLPKPWKECFDLDKVLTLFRELGFRTLSERVKKLNSNGSPTAKGEMPKAEGVESKDLCLMLWVIDSNITNPTLEDVWSFTKTESPEEARKILKMELDKRKVRNVYEDIEKPLMIVVEKMNERGIKVDKLLLVELSKKYHKELSRIEKEIWKHAGVEFNVNSPKVLSNILFTKLELADKRQKKTPGGVLSTKESELEKLRDKHPIISLILEYRELSKLLSTYIDAIPPLLDKNSRLHSTFIQAGSSTGRMASNNPNLQNIPIKTELGRAIRKSFVTDKGLKLLSIDYSQIELRLAAILSEDKKLIEIFKKGEDVHAGVAARVFKVRPEEVTREMRIKAKTINFGILYGMGVNALRENLGTDRKEAQEFYNEYFKTFTGLSAYLDGIKAETARKGYTETMFGRRRYFSGFNSPLPYVRAQAERMAINAPIQGSQADLIKIAMRKIGEKFPDAHLLLQVHDELVYEVREEEVDEMAREFKKIMETVIPEEKLKGVPILAEANVGNNWGEMSPWSH